MKLTYVPASVGSSARKAAVQASLAAARPISLSAVMSQTSSDWYLLADRGAAETKVRPLGERRATDGAW